MAISFVGFGATAVSQGSASIPYNSDSKIDDLAILFIETSGDGTTLTPSGWTHVTGSPRVDVASTAGSKLHILYKWVDADAPANFGSGDSGDHQIAKVFTFRGVSKTNPFNAIASISKTTASTTATSPSVTTTVDNAMVTWYVSRPDDSSSNAHFGPSSSSTLENVYQGADFGALAGNGGGGLMGFGTKKIAGTVGTITRSKAVSTTEVAFTIALTPADPAENPDPVATGPVIATENWTAANGTAWPNTWTTTGTGIDIQDNQGRMFMTTANAGRGAILNNTSVRNVEALFQYVPAQVDTGRQAGIYFRANNAVGGYYNDAYALEFGINTTYLLKKVGGVNTTLASGGYGWVPGSLYWVRVEMSESTVGYKIWPRAATEPSNWTTSLADTSIDLAGGIELYFWSGATAVTQEVRFDKFSVSDYNYVAPPPQTGLVLDRWNGSTLIRVSEKRWNGSSLVDRKYPTPSIPAGSSSGTLVSTDGSTVLNQSAALGMNSNLWEDNQVRRTSGARDLSLAYSDIKAKIIRYPGGEKSDGTTFFQSTNQATPNPRLNRIGSDAWPSNDTTYWTTPTAEGTWASGRPPYSLETFLNHCQSSGAEPIIVTALDGIYLNPPAGAGIRPTKAEMITNASELVRWCNVTNNYNVKYWEIGNEPWLVGYLGGTSNPVQYATDFADVAAAMKAVDPTILVGASGNTEAYFDGILNTAAASVDFLTVHPYDTAGMAYSTYRTATLDASQIGSAWNSLQKQSAQHRDRIFITVTETSHFATSNTDANAYNNLGSAIITAHFLGMQMSNSVIRHVIFWNTRWIYNTQANKLAYDAFAPDNSLLPVGQALRFLGHLNGKVISSSTSASGIITYASRSESENRSSVLIINRSTTSQSGTIGMYQATRATGQRLSGSGPTDQAPVITDLGPISVTNSTSASITCPGDSLTLINFYYD